MLRERGLRIVSPHGDATLHPRIATAAELGGPFDAILLAVKAFALDAAMEDFAPAVGAGTAILPVLNGLKHMDLLTARFGRDAVAGCACKIAAQVDGDGRIVQLAPLPQEIAYGEMDGTATPRLHALDAFLQGAGFEARLSPAIAREMWEKWILLATLGGITCLMRGTVGEIAAAPGGADFILRFLDEVVAVVRAAGVPPGDAFLAGARALLTAKGSPMTSSMYRDLQQGQPVEADQIVGDLLVRGAAAGVKTPLIALAYASLSVYQNRRPSR
ncbi:MAG: 2-dehydropantoate 2-reductase [Rhizomicrobium sp.]